MINRIKSFLFNNKTLKQTVLKNVFWLTFGQFLGRLIKAVLIIYVARILGAAGYGVFSYALSLAAFFTLFADIGISPILTREAAKNPEKEQAYFSTAFVIKLILVTFSIGLIIVVAPLATNIKEAIPLFPIVALLLAFDGFRDFTFAISRAKEKMQIEALLTILTNVAIVVAGLFVIFTMPSPRTLTIAYAIGSGVGFVISLWVVRKYLRGLLTYFDFQLAKTILKEAWPFALMGFLGGIMINTDTIMLGWLKDASEVGFYSAAQRPIQLLYLPVTILATSIFPALARFARDDKAAFRYIFEKAVKLAFLAALPLLVGGVILSKEIIILLFSPEYLPSIIPFSILLFTVLAIYPGTLIGNAVFAFNQQKNFVIFLAVGAIGNVFFNYLLIPSYGAMGSAFATIGAQVLANGFMWWKLKKIAQFKTIKYLPKIIIATFIMGAVTITLKSLDINFLINLLVSMATYFAALSLLRESILKEFKSAISA